MAWDEALLDQAEQLTLRCYYWQPAAVSLGYFQDYQNICSQLPQDMPLVRRITGGGAIWHEHEVTYSLVGTLGKDGLPHRTQDCYPLLHQAINQQILAAGGSSGIQPETVGDRRYQQDARCFASPAQYDLLSADPAQPNASTTVSDHTPNHNSKAGKILGSAARTRGERVLIHGSLKCDTNPWDQEVSASCGLNQDEAEEVLVSAIASALGQRVQHHPFTDAEKIGSKKFYMHVMIIQTG